MNETTQPLFQLFDIVKLTKQVKDYPPNTQGTLVEKLANSTYIVEFADPTGKILSLETVYTDQITKEPRLKFPPFTFSTSKKQTKEEIEAINKLSKKE